MQGRSGVRHKDLLCDVIFPCLVTGAVCVYSFRQETKFSQRKFFLRYGTGKPENITKELDYLQRDYSMTYMTSSQARHVLETIKCTVDVDTTSNPGIYMHKII